VLLSFIIILPLIKKLKSKTEKNNSVTNIEKSNSDSNQNFNFSINDIDNENENDNESLLNKKIIEMTNEIINLKDINIK